MKLKVFAGGSSRSAAIEKRRSRVLGGRPVVGHMPLEHGTLVRIQASQPSLESFQYKGEDDG